MKYRVSFLVLLSLLTLGPSLRAWDFTPKEVSTFVDGPSPRHYFLASGERKINFRVGLRTSVSGGPDATLFTFPEISGATLKLTQSPFSEKKPVFKENLPIYLAAAQKSLPEGATDIVLLEEVENVFPINDWTSYRFTFKYGFYGRTMRTSITFLNYNPKEQWLVEVSSNEADAEKISAVASRILNTFNETDLNYKLEEAPN